MANNTSQFKKEVLEQAEQRSVEEIREAIGGLQALASDKEEAQAPRDDDKSFGTFDNVVDELLAEKFASEHTDTSERAGEIFEEMALKKHSDDK